MRKPRKIEARPTKWQVITDYGTRYGVRFYATKKEADVVCAGINMRGVGKLIADHALIAWPW